MILIIPEEKYIKQESCINDMQHFLSPVLSATSAASIKKCYWHKAPTTLYQYATFQAPKCSPKTMLEK